MIPEQYKFCNFGEFYIKRDNISVWYDTIDKEGKELYYWYLASRPKLKGLEYDAYEVIFDWLRFELSDELLNKYYELWRYFNDK